MSNISIIKDDTYKFLNEHTFRINNHSIEKIETKTNLQAGSEIV